MQAPRCGTTRPNARPSPASEAASHVHQSWHSARCQRLDPNSWTTASRLFPARVPLLPARGSWCLSTAALLVLTRLPAFPGACTLPARASGSVLGGSRGLPPARWCSLLRPRGSFLVRQSAIYPPGTQQVPLTHAVPACVVGFAARGVDCFMQGRGPPGWCLCSLPRAWQT